jgi:hypothetical protein
MPAHVIVMWVSSGCQVTRAILLYVL